MSTLLHCPDPVFIVGTERSGSNLLREMLDSHSQLCVPHPPHIMNYLGSLEPLYGDLEGGPAMRRLIDDVRGLLRVHINPWPRVPQVDALEAALPERSLYGVLRALYQLRASDEGKPRWGCKSTFMVHHVDTVVESTPAARFVWLVRDPRDVAVSSRRSVFSPCHPYLTAKLWTRQQAEARTRCDMLGDDRILRVHYEALVADPRATLEAVCEFLSLEFEATMLDYHARATTRRSASLSRSWENTAAPPSTKSVGQFGSELTADELALVESIAGELMDELGYARVTAAVGPSDPGDLELYLSEARLRVRVEWDSLKFDANHWRRWARNGFVWRTSAWRRIWGAAASRG